MWVEKNCTPDELFSKKDLIAWVTSQGIEEIFSEEEVQDHAMIIGMPAKWIREVAQEDNHPDDIFSEKELSEWAENNGFVKSE